MRLIATVVLLVQITQITAIAIDNGLAGNPSISCMDDVIRFSFDTQKAFTGRVFVKGRHGDPDCSGRYDSSGGASRTTIMVHIGSCGMQRAKVNNPRGMQMRIILVVSFHRIFITKVDRAFAITCLYRTAQQYLTASIGIFAVLLVVVGIVSSGLCSSFFIYILHEICLSFRENIALKRRAPQSRLQSRFPQPSTRIQFGDHRNAAQQPVIRVERPSIRFAACALSVVQQQQQGREQQQQQGVENEQPDTARSSLSLTSM